MSSRRTFIKACSALLVTLWWPTDWLAAQTRQLAFSLSKVKKLRAVDGWAILKIKGRHIMFVRDTEETIVAVDSVCTHKQCTVEYDTESKKIVCPCHGSKYRLDGTVLSPPAEKPLKAYPVILTDDKVVITIEA